MQIAAYDMDGTIITTITGKTFPKNADDWRLLQPTKLTAKLLELKSEGFAIVLISNQKARSHCLIPCVHFLHPIHTA